MRKNSVIVIGTVCAFGAANAIPLPRFLFPHHAHDEIGAWFQELLAQDEADMALAAEDKADYVPHVHVEHGAEEPDAPSEHDVLKHIMGHDEEDHQHKHEANHVHPAVLETASILPELHHEDHQWTHSHASHGFDTSSDFLDGIHKDHQKHHEHAERIHPHAGLVDHSHANTVEHLVSSQNVEGQRRSHGEHDVNDHLSDTKPKASSSMGHSHDGEVHVHSVGHEIHNYFDHPGYDRDLLGMHDRYAPGSHSTGGRWEWESAEHPYRDEHTVHHGLQYQHDPLIASSNDEWTHYPYEHEALYHDGYRHAPEYGYYEAPRSPVHFVHDDDRYRSAHGFPAYEHGYFERSATQPLHRQEHVATQDSVRHGHHFRGHDGHLFDHQSALLHEPRSAALHHGHTVQQHVDEKEHEGQVRHEGSFAHQHLRNINSAFKHDHPNEHGIHASAMGGAHDPLVGKSLFDVMMDASSIPM